METYAQSAKNIRDQIARTRGDEADSLSALNEKIRQTYQDKLQDFTNKWQGVEQIGGAIEQTLPLFKTGRRLYKKFKEYRDVLSPKEADEQDLDAGTTEDGGVLKSMGFSEEDADRLVNPERYDAVDDGSRVGVQIPDSADPPDITGVSESDIPSGAGGAAEPGGDVSGLGPRDVSLDASDFSSSSQPTSLSSRTIEPDDDDPFQAGFYNRIPVRATQTGGKQITTEDLPSQSQEEIQDTLDNAADIGKNTASEASDILDGAKAAATDVGEDLGSFFTGDAIASAIPVVGEAAAALGGLVAIGTGIGELISEKHDTPNTVPIATSIPNSLTDKYSDSMPSNDSFIQRSSASSVF